MQCRWQARLRSAPRPRSPRRRLKGDGRAYTACAYKRPTKALQDALAKGAADGGLPIVLDGKIVGAIGVSGAAGPDDARVGQAGIDALK